MPAETVSSLYAAREGLERDDVVGILLHLGKDCTGALSVVPVGAPPVKVPGDLNNDYDELTEEKLIAILTSLHVKGSLPDNTRDPSPLAGVQSKIALTLLPNSRFATPKPDSGAPTTHILKVPDTDHPNDPTLEAATLDISRSLGLPTCEARILNVGRFDVLLITRFDRTLNEDGLIARLHQEDFAQALGLPPSLKYERNGNQKRRFDVAAIGQVLDATIDPAGERDQFVRSTVFDLLTGNMDAHAKNHAVIHLRPNSIIVAPRYDLLPTRLDPNLTNELPFKIGSASKLAAITLDDFHAFLRILGIESEAARLRTIERHALEISNGLVNALPELTEKGLKAYADLIAQNMRDLLPAVGLPVADAAKTRDAFIARGGGWLNS